MKKPSKLKILRITEYKGFHILIQVFLPLCQFIAFKDGKFYQGHNFITPAKGVKKYTKDDLVKIGSLMLTYAYTTIDLILAKDNPDKLIKENEQGAEVLKILEDKPVEKSVN